MNPRLFTLVKWIALSLLCLLLQTTLVRFLSIRGVVPDLLLLVTIFIAIREGSFAGAVAGFLCGLMLDVYAPETLGSGAFAKCLVGFLMGLMNERTVRVDGPLRLLVLFLGAFLHGVILELFIQGTDGFVAALHYPILPAALFTALAGAIPILFLQRKG